MKKTVYTLALLTFSVAFSSAQTQWPLQEYLHRTGKNANEFLGTYVRSLGDLNGDGKPDIAISDGSPDHTPAYSETGVWYITDHTDTVPEVRFKGQNLTMGDINGDGYKDFITWKQIVGGVGVDTVFVCFGSSSGIDTVADLALAAENRGDDFGRSIAIGDLNNDGINDFVIGSPGYDGARGKVYIYFGRAHISSKPDFNFVGDTNFATLGSKLAIGELNDDGIVDLAVSGYKSIASVDYINIYFGGVAFDTNRDFALTGITGQPLEGGLAIMDANGDGKKDLLWASIDTHQGIFIHFGRRTLSTVPDIVLRVPSFGGLAFSTIIDAGDMDGDGYHDIAVSDIGAFQGGGFVFIYRGGPALDTLWDAGKGRPDGSKFGSTMDTVGDINDDGLSDIVIGGPEYAFGTNQGYFGIFMGDRRITAVHEIATTNLPHIAHLEQNYPNPFNPRTDFRFEVRGFSFVVLKIFDVMGREMKTLVSETKPQGEYTVTWDATDVQSGIYFYRLTVSTSDGKFYRDTKKVALIK